MKLKSHNKFRRQLDMGWLLYIWSWWLNPETMKRVHKVFSFLSDNTISKLNKDSLKNGAIATKTK